MRYMLLLLMLPALATPQSDSQGRKVVDEAVAALGGPRFTSMRNHVETGRAFSFYRSDVSGLDIATIYTEYVEPPPAKGLAVREREAFGKKKEDYAILLTGTEGYEVTFRGARPLPDERWKRYQTSTLTDVFYLLRERLNDPKMTYDFVRSDVILNRQVNIVDITDPENRTVRVYFDLINKVPIRQEYSDWDPIGQQRTTELTDYAKYRTVDGLQWPFVIQRERNGESTFELFADSVKFDENLPATTFELPSGAKILKKLN